MDQRYFNIQFTQKTRAGFINSAQKSSKAFSLNVRFEYQDAAGLEIYSWQIRRRTEERHASAIYVKRFKEKEVEVQKAGEQFTVPCASGSIK